MKIGLINLGCPKNIVDLECMLSHLNNFTVTRNLTKADAVIINTCGFIKKARKESEREIKNVINFKKNNKKLKIIVAGCFFQKEAENLIKKYKGVIDSFVGVNDIKNIKKAIQKKGIYLNEKPYIYSSKKRKILINNISSYVKIADGCNRKCSFCTIPKIKGNYRSRKIEDILIEIKNLIKSGVKEINLISQDSSYYGVDIYSQKKLGELVKKILKEIREYFWLRILYLYPDVEIIKELIQIMKNDTRLCRYFDIPFQHINNKILTKMKRGHNKKYILNIIKIIRKNLKDAVIRSSFIIGFPGEDEKIFNELLNFIKKGYIDKPGYFEYSDEKGTEAYLLKNKNKINIIKKRANKFNVVSKNISYYNNIKTKNDIIEGLIIGKKEKNIFLARTKYNAPDIDDYIEIESKNNNIKLGEFYNIKIKEIIKTNEKNQ